MKRLIAAFANSRRALVQLASQEAAIRLELRLLVLSVPASFLIAQTPGRAVLLVASILFLLLVEILNTAIEAACNAITREHDEDIRLAKDSGSLAVLVATVLVGGFWIWTGISRLL